MSADRIRRRLLGAVALFPLRAAAQESTWDALKAGGCALLLRHAATEAGVGDPPGFRLEDCRTQRNLSAAGREQAARLGQGLRDRSLRIDAVLSSRWCRCLETARLAFPERTVEGFPPLDSFFDDRSAEPARTRATRERIAAIRAPANAVFVTHQVNIVALTGRAVAPGELIVLRIAEGLRPLGVLQF